MVHCTVRAYRDSLVFLGGAMGDNLVRELRSMMGGGFIQLPCSRTVRVLGRSGERFRVPVMRNVSLGSRRRHFLIRRCFYYPVVIAGCPGRVGTFCVGLGRSNGAMQTVSVLFPRVKRVVKNSRHRSSCLELHRQVRRLNVGVGRL